MSFTSNPGKRIFEHGASEFNGKGKRRKSVANQSKAPPGAFSLAAFRILCPASRAGGVIGKGGSVVSHIRNETGAKVIIEDAIPGCDERIIVVEAFDKESAASGEPGKEENGEDNAPEEGGGEKGPTENEKDDKYLTLGDAHDSTKGLSSVEKALLLVFQRIVDGAAEAGGMSDYKTGTCVLRMLIFSSQVGCLLGKGGAVIKRMSYESGTQIRILPRDNLPSCVSTSEELVQVLGGVEQIKKALILISQQILSNLPRENSFFSAFSGGPHTHGQGHPEEMIMPHAAADSGGLPPMPKYGGGGFSGRMKPAQDLLIFRLLCSVEKAGSVIGRGGNILRTVQFDTGCAIEVLDGKMMSEDLIIEISGHVHPEDRISASQDALLRIQSRIATAEPGSVDNPLSARLLLASSQIGWVVGKSGVVINELKKLSGAYIRIMGKDQRPKCVPDNEDVVHISGDFEAIQEALVLITSRVRNHLFKDFFPSVNNGADPAFFDRGPPFHPMGRGEFSPPRMHPGLGPPFCDFDGVENMPPPGAFPFREDRPFSTNMNRHGTPSHISERLPMPPSHWDPQGRGEGASHMGFPEFGRFPERRIPGDGPVITHTTVEAVVPSALVPAIYGESGGCLDHIRQISEAKVVITETNPGAMETVIIISGTPEQTHAAQSLIQAFVISESQSLM